MNRMTGLKQRVGIVLAALTIGVSKADDAAWNKTAAGTYDWTNGVNWLPSTTFPNGAGQVANITNDILGAQTIQLRRSLALGGLNIGDALASNVWNTVIQNSGSETFSMTLDSGAAGVAAVINGGNSGTTTVSLNAPLALNSDVLVSIGGNMATNIPKLAFGATLAMNGRTMTFTNGLPGQLQFSFELGANLTGDGTLLNAGYAMVSVTGSKAFGGKLIANRGGSGSNTGSFTLTNGGFTNAAEFVINGCLTNGSTQAGGCIHSGNNAGFVNNPGQRWTAKRVTLNGGSLDDGGQAAGNNGGNPTNDWQRGIEYVRDNVATVTLNSAYCYVGINASATTTGTLFNVGTLIRNPGASVYMNGPNASNKLFLARNATNYLKGAAGSGKTQVIPWAGLYLGGNPSSPSSFGTYTEGLGFRGLADAEYTNRVAAGADYNVSVSSVALSEDATVNTLRVASNNAPSNIGSNRTLTVTSGGVFFTSGGVGVSGSSSAGTLSFGGAEGVVWALGAYTNSIGAKIVGTGGLTKTGTGLLILTGANNYSGANHISGGTLQVGDGTYAGTLGSGSVYVHEGALLVLSCSSAIADGAAVSLYRYGLFNGRMQLDAGVNEAIRFLTAGGVGRPSGTYGSRASPAQHKDDQYFAGTGVLTVTGNASLLLGGTVITLF